MTARRIVVAAVTIFVLVSGSSRAQTLYTLTDLGESTADGEWTVANAINESGQVVGLRDDRGFLWEAGVGLTDIGSGVAYDINDNGQAIVGGYLWEEGTSSTGIGGSCFAINNSGQVVGRNGSNAFLWEEGVGMTSLGAGSAYDINDSGQVIGYVDSDMMVVRSFLWEEGIGRTYTDDFEEFEPHTCAWGINNLGQVVGYSVASTGMRAFLWEKDGTMINLGDLPGGDDGSEAWAINDKGQVVGSSEVGANAETAAFLWEEGSGMINLNEQLDSSGDGWWLRQARDINESGQIVGYGRNSDGNFHAFLLTPVPEPTTIWMLGLAGLVFGRSRFNGSEKS